MTVTSADCSDAAPLPPESVPHFIGIRIALFSPACNTYAHPEHFQEFWKHEDQRVLQNFQRHEARRSRDRDRGGWSR